MTHIWQSYPMDTFFIHCLGSYTWSARCGITKDLGFDASYLTLMGDREWDLLPKLADCERDYGLPVEAVYAMTSADDATMWSRIRNELLPQLPVGTALELAVMQPEDNSHAPAIVTAQIVDQIKETLAMAGETKVRLYPHLGFWLETTAAALALRRLVDDERLQVNFCGFHWFAGDKQGLPELLTDAQDCLGGVNLAGSRTGGALYGYTIESLDQGMLDNFIVLAQLQKTGYTGRLGLQGYANGGDVYEQLRRSRDALQSLQTRLVDHPEWADFSFTPTEHLASFRAQAAATDT